MVVSSYNVRQLPLLAIQSDASSFSNFWLSSEAISGSNAELSQGLQQLVVQGEPTPFYLHGSTGSGKTHLLSATMRFNQEEGNLPTSFFDLAAAHTQPEQLSSLESYRLICVDNVDAWAGYSAGEQALFNLVEQVKQRQWPLLLAAQSKPQQAGFALADLVSRLDSGVVYRVHELDDVGAFEAIRLRVKQRGLVISDDAINYLLTHFARDKHSLFKAIDQLDKASLVAKRKITIPFMQQILSEI